PLDLGRIVVPGGCLLVEHAPHGRHAIGRRAHPPPEPVRVGSLVPSRRPEGDVNRRGRAAAMVAALTILVSCGGGGGSGSSGTTADDAGTTEVPGTADDTTTTTESAEPELPDADPSTYIGRNRVVHLLVRPDGSTPTLDIWARRSFEYAPILLVEGLEYGEVSDWYGRPDHVSVVAVESGAGPDADSVADLFSANADQTYTHLVMFDRDRDAASGFLLEDDDPASSNTFPEAEPGAALVQLYAYQLRLNPLS